MDLYRTPKPRKLWTPEQRAAYARAKLGVSCEYIPQATRNEAAIQRRAEKAIAHKAEIDQRRIGRAVARAAMIAARHDAHVKLFKSNAVQFRLRYWSEPEFAVKQRLRTQLRKKAKLYPKLDDLMRDAIKRCGNSKTVEIVCGYTIGELVAHLESKFTDGMTWEAFLRGEIHIDHVIAQVHFDLTDEGAVRRCWALTNLQPLWAADNLAKGARLDWEGARMAA